MRKNSLNPEVISRIKDSKAAANRIRRFPVTFADTIAFIMKEKGISKTRLSIDSNMSERTIQRLRNDEEYSTTKQNVIALCVGLKLSLQESLALVERSPVRLILSSRQDAAYYEVLALEGRFGIEEINECLEAAGITPIGC